MNYVVDLRHVKHIVALSGGKDSTAMALRLREMNTEVDYDFICTPTGNELPEMALHWDRLGTLLGKPVKCITNGRTLSGLIVQWRALPNWRMRWCTRVLKIEPFQEYIAQHTPCVVYVGIRADEADREGVDYGDALIQRTFPLVEWGWGLGDVKKFLADRGVSIPERTDCAICFFQTIYEWWKLWQQHPGEFDRAIAFEELTGHTLRSDQRDTWPAALKDLKKEFESGRLPRQRKTMEDRKLMCSVCAH
jgi:3'-phosphoadenosine 5'-phosphosulfate sulfotransferase (PAPS reductase)/FAD synthetase